MASRSVVLVLCAALAVPTLGWAQDEEPTQKPTLSFDLRITPGRSPSQHQIELLTYLNERLIDKQGWVDDKECAETDVLSSLPRGISELSKVDLAARVAEEVLKLDSLPFDEMAEGLDRFELYADGRLVRVTQFSEPAGEDQGGGGTDPTDPHGCTPTTTVQGPTCVAQPPVTTNHPFTRPCILSHDHCNAPVWGSQACSVTMTSVTTVCTITTTTTWTPNAPGVVCPAPVVIPSSTTTTSTTTGTPTCGPCQ